jgi:hypothetical protein
MSDYQPMDEAVMVTARCGCSIPAGPKGRFWFYKPCWYFGGWNWWVRWMPIWLGGDEYCRRTLVLGHNVTGQLVIALWQCRGCEDCSDSPRKRPNGATT